MEKVQNILNLKSYNKNIINLLFKLVQNILICFVSVQNF